ncbi:putative transcriptional regulator [Streptococcus infantarius subsp. infantarius]|nr:putative transcriptional regulator [Streptococcus infantarius subsp. infantarius]MCO4489575.1 putative transcriptional regulator [Streptococcus infantarius subsp. infantarius]MCO4491550.1 putative transcriptional regulator [Streptococcus infantarius subsp. infantarius]MCO4507439.1 putative transcriptional regulator [Streptococcus infantarius subsp. infantarius]MCO4516877.1 putative transcriptional regulator [Streptococcus infantarius subsp. infantarius]
MNRLKELRKEKKYTQAQIAELMGVNVKTISRWEKGEFEIKPPQAKMLADYFGVSPEYLLGYSKYKSLLDITKDFLDNDSDNDIDPEYMEEIKEREERLETERLRRVNSYGLSFYTDLFKFRSDELYEMLIDLTAFFIDKAEKGEITKQDIELGEKLIEILNTEKVDIHDTILQTSEIINRFVHRPNIVKNKHTPTDND